MSKTMDAVIDELNKRKEHPILFSGEMVRAILDLRKRQTRRVIKFGREDTSSIQRATSIEWDMRRADDRMPCFDTWGPQKAHFLFKEPSNYDGSDIVFALQCPYGQQGDHLWVRETFVLESDREYVGDVKLPTNCPIKTIPDDGEWGEYHLIPHYRATDPEPNIVSEEQEDFDDRTRWTPSIFMPRWASRITLEITRIRVERLQEISEADAKAEGVKQVAVNLSDNTDVTPYKKYYRQLWDSINGKKHPWESNPWVWVIEFAVWDDKSTVIPEGAKVV